MASKIDGDAAPMALHARIRTDVEQQIMSGALKPGDRIPFEHELMEQYGCSRMTVNKALSTLATAGLINRRRRAGSFVARQYIEMAALSIPDIRETIVGRGFEYGLRLVQRDDLDAEDVDPERMEGETTGRVLHLLCQHLANREVFAVEDRLISLEAVPDAAEADFTLDPPGSWLLKHVPWTEAEHRIAAARAGDQAALLKLKPDAPCLVLHRRTWRGQAVVTDVQQFFPANGFSLNARFMASGGE